jgi:hypothetical protein
VMCARLQGFHLVLQRIARARSCGSGDAHQHERTTCTCESSRRSCAPAPHEGGTVAQCWG